jgi:hypothetical protein
MVHDERTGPVALGEYAHTVGTGASYHAGPNESTVAATLAKRLAQEHSGFVASYLEKLDEFFQQWLRGTTRPTLTPTAFFRQVPPRLAIRSINADQLEIAWPKNTVRFVLEQSKDLTGASWTTVSLTPAVLKGQAKVILAQPDGNQFYRLRNE